MILEISALVAALSLLVLVYFLVGLIRQARTSLDRIQQIVQTMEHNVSELSRESVKLLLQSQGITRDVQGKLDSANTLFRSAEQVGASVQQVAHSFGQVSSTVSRTVQEARKSVQEHRGRATEMTDWVFTGLLLWQKWQTVRQERGTNGKNSTLKGEESHVGQ